MSKISVMLIDRHLHLNIFPQKMEIERENVQHDYPAAFFLSDHMVKRKPWLSLIKWWNITKLKCCFILRGVLDLEHTTNPPINTYNEQNIWINHDRNTNSHTQYTYIKTNSSHIFQPPKVQILLLWFLGIRVNPIRAKPSNKALANTVVPRQPISLARESGREKKSTEMKQGNSVEIYGWQPGL